MELELGKDCMNEAKISAIRARFMALKDDKGYSWMDLFRLTNIHNSTLSLWGTNKYKGDNAGIAKTLEDWMKSLDNNQAIIAALPTKIPFIMTDTAQKIQNNLFWSSMGKMTAIIGDPGLGKTEAIADYCAKNPNSWSICLSPTRKSMKAVLSELARVMDVNSIGADVRGISNSIRKYLENRGGVIAIDEAQNLSEMAIEELRAIHDDTKVGLSFIGNAEVKTRIEGNAREAAYAQRFSRLAFLERLILPTENDVKLILDAWQIEIEQERNFLKQIAMQRGGGTLRTISNVLELATFTSNSTGCPRNYNSIKDAFLQLHQNQTGVL